MKRFFICLFFVLLSPVFAEPKVDLDLTRQPPNMVYSTVFNMLVEPEFFDNKVIKISGECKIFKNESDGSDVYGCIILDAMKCCAQGVEFRLSEKYKPSDYPKEGEVITVVGTFEWYEYEGMDAFRLGNASLR